MEASGNSMTGRAKTVLVYHAGGISKAIITSLVARILDKTSPERLSFKGSCDIQPEIRLHFEKTILPIVDEILHLLGIPSKSFELSVVNAGATSSSDTGINLQGYSADAPAFLALLSAALEMPVRQNVVCTGHIASPGGDIAPVGSLPQKIDVALRDPEIKTFVFPSLEQDSSMKDLTSEKYEEAVTAIRRSRGKIKQKDVRDIAGLLEATLETESIVSSSLRNGYFDKPLPAGAEDGPVRQAASFLCRENETIFWKLLERHLFSKEMEAGQGLLRLFADFHIAGKRYPKEFGEKLQRILISLPPYIRRQPGLFPLLERGTYIRIVQFAGEPDHEDIGRLLNVINGQVRGSQEPLKKTSGQEPTALGAEALLDHLLEEIDDETINQRVYRFYDEARASFILDKVTVESNEEFLETITSFYTHVLRRTGTEIIGPISENLSAEALDVLKRAIHGREDYNSILAEAKNASRGGLRYILDLVTDHLKHEAREKYIFRAFKEAIDTLDDDIRVSLIAAIMKREGDRLPPNIASQPPERYAHQYEEILRLYSQSLARVVSRLKAL